MRRSRPLRLALGSSTVRIPPLDIYIDIDIDIDIEIEIPPLLVEGEVILPIDHSSGAQ